MDSNSSGTQPQQVVAGLRVVRGPDWKWGNQDASEGYVGTVIKFKKNKLSGLSGLSRLAKLSSLSGLLDSKVLGVVSVIWDCGIKNDYRIGYEGAFDLRVVDNSATGVNHSYISCIECCIDSDITGIRWHCEECDLSICSLCFFQSKHDETHTKFKRYETPTSQPYDVVLDPTKNNERVELKGMFKTSRVKRGHDWKKGDEDTADGVSGVGWLMESRNQVPGMVQVKWQNKQTYPYRLGADGKVDLQLVKVASGGFYHPEHLPVLKSSFMNSVTNSDGEVKFAMGDCVQIFIGDEEELKKFQDGHGGYVSDIKKYIGKPGTVRSLNEVGVIVVYEDGNFFNLNPEILVRLSPFSKDQPVRIKDDEITIRAMENQFGIQARKLLAGETGRVVSSSEENDYIEVIIDSDKKNEIKHLHRDWVEILTGDKKVAKKVAELKSKMVSAFVQAAASGQLNAVKEILTKYPINIDAKNDSGETAMHLACRNGHLEIIKELYFKAKEKGFTILEQQDGDGKRPIHHATEGCHWKVLSFLIKPDDDPKTKGADLNVKDNKSLTALQIAVRAGCLQSVKLLIENGSSDINSQDSDGDAALHNAIIIEKQYYRDPQIIIELLSSKEINLKLQNKRGLNPLLLSVAVNNRVAFNELLKAGGEELANEVETPNRLTVLHLACYKGELQIAKDFLKRVSESFENKEIKSYLENRCKGGLTPLSLAILQGHYALVELLVEQYKADVQTADDDGDTLVHLAAMKLEKLTDEPNPKTSPAISKIHEELKKKHDDTIVCYPGLSLMCYLISKGCPWRKTRTGKAKAVINNELIRDVLETYGPPPEEPMDVENDGASEDGCIFCSNRSSVFKTIGECGHMTNVACSPCFHSRLRKCPTCRRQTNSSSNEQSMSPSIPDALYDELFGNLMASSDKQYSNNKVFLNVGDQTGNGPVQHQASTQYGYPDNGPSTSGYQVPPYQQPTSQSNQFPTGKQQPNVGPIIYDVYYIPATTQQPQQNPAFYNQGNNLIYSGQGYSDAVQPTNYSSTRNLHFHPYPQQNRHGHSNISQSTRPPNFNSTHQVIPPDTVNFAQPHVQTSTTTQSTVNDWQSDSTQNNQVQFQNFNHSIPAPNLSPEGVSEPVPVSFVVDSANPSTVTTNQSNETDHQPQFQTISNSANGFLAATANNYIVCERKENANKEKNAPILEYNGNRYSKQRTVKGKTHTTWQCTKNANEKRSKCPATIIEEIAEGNNSRYRIGYDQHVHFPANSSTARNGI